MFGQHQPLNRQSERYLREGVDLSVSALADQVGAATAELGPLHDLTAAKVLAAERLLADGTTVPILARGKADTGIVWTYVRDDRPFGGTGLPATFYFALRDRRQEHLEGWRGILKSADYGGYNGRYDPARKVRQVASALCWATSSDQSDARPPLRRIRQRSQQGPAFFPRYEIVDDKRAHTLTCLVGC